MPLPLTEQATALDLPNAASGWTHKDPSWSRKHCRTRRTPPTIGLGTGGGFSYVLHDTGGGSPRTLAQVLQVPTSAIFQALQASLGGYYVNDINLFVLPGWVLLVSMHILISDPERPLQTS